VTKEIRANGLLMNSTLHVHSEACLSPVSQVPVALGEIKINPKTGAVETPLADVEPGWFKCSTFHGYWLHDHGVRLVSHVPRDAFAACPR